MTKWFLAIASVTFVSLLSLIGIAFISVNEEKLRRIIFVMVSLAVGALFGDAFIHLLPESFERSQSSVKTSLYVLAGMLSFFVLEKFLLWKHQHILESSDHVHPVGYMNLAADAVHNLIDGMIIGVAYLVSVPVGIATTIAAVSRCTQSGTQNPIWNIGDDQCSLGAAVQITRTALALRFYT
jgi:zinc and cadmium transporter